jgi:hypothetical protein
MRSLGTETYRKLYGAERIHKQINKFVESVRKDMYLRQMIARLESVRLASVGLSTFDHTTCLTVCRAMPGAPLV